MIRSILLFNLAFAVVLLSIPKVHAMGNQSKEELTSTGVSSIVVEGANSLTAKALTIGQKSIKLSEAQPCSITVQIPKAGKTSLSILNEKDEVIEVLVDKELVAGPHAFFWNTANVPAGTYTVLLKAVDEVKRDKIEIRQ